MRMQVSNSFAQTKVAAENHSSHLHGMGTSQQKLIEKPITNFKERENSVSPKLQKGGTTITRKS